MVTRKSPWNNVDPTQIAIAVGVKYYHTPVSSCLCITAAPNVNQRRICTEIPGCEYRPCAIPSFDES
jgi:hypothetical protein